MFFFSKIFSFKRKNQGWPTCKLVAAIYCTLFIIVYKVKFASSGECAYTFHAAAFIIKYFLSVNVNLRER